MNDKGGPPLHVAGHYKSSTRRAIIFKMHDFLPRPVLDVSTIRSKSFELEMLEEHLNIVLIAKCTASACR